MENKKVEKFTNFNYVVLAKSDPKYVDVQVKFKYKGEQAIHIVSFRSVPGKTNAYYIDKAKAKIAQYEKNGRLVKIATKSISASKDTFYQRHKKGVNALLAVAAVGAVAGATAALIIHFSPKPDPTAVTEEEIDSYLEGPAGNSKQISETWARKILLSATENYTTNLKEIETKMISSESLSDLIDNYLYKFDSSKGRQVDTSFLNDTTGFYTNDALKQKKYCKSYMKGRILNDKQLAKAATIYTKDSLEGLENGINYTAKLEANDVYKCGPNPDGGIMVFRDKKYNYDGYSGSNMEKASAEDTYFETRQQAGEEIRNNMLRNSTYFTGVNILLDEGELTKFRVSEDNATVYYKQEEIEHISTEGIATPITIHYETIWCFKNLGEGGWVLDSFASDGALSYMQHMSTNNAGMQYAPIYVEYNDKGEKLDKPFNVNKDKMFTKIKYGELDEDESIDEIKYDGYKDIDMPAVIEAAGIYFPNGSGEEEPMPMVASDITRFRRVDNPDFDGYSLMGIVADDPQCPKNSAFAIGTQTDDGITKVYGWDELEEYLNHDYFDKGAAFKYGDNSIYLIKLKKAGWLTFEIVIDSKLESMTNFIVNFHEGPSPIINF